MFTIIICMGGFPLILAVVTLIGTKLRFGEASWPVQTHVLIALVLGTLAGFSMLFNQQANHPERFSLVSSTQQVAQITYDGKTYYGEWTNSVLTTISPTVVDHEAKRQRQVVHNDYTLQGVRLILSFPFSGYEGSSTLHLLPGDPLPSPN